MKINFEMLKSSKKAATIMIVAVSIAFVSVVVLSQFWINSNKINEIYVKNANYIDINELKLLASHTISSEKDSIDLFEIENLIQKHPFVKKCDASFMPNGKLILKIKEKEISAFVAFGNGNLKLLDNKGNYLPYKLYNGFEKIPLVTGLSSNTHKLHRKQAVKIIQKLQQSENQTIFALISELRFDKEIAGFQMILADYDSKLIVGNDENIEEKINNFRIFSKNALFKDEFSKIRYIDLRWKNKVIIKKI
jgi:cell division protein FtsQ